MSNREIESTFFGVAAPEKYNPISVLCYYVGNKGHIVIEFEPINALITLSPLAAKRLRDALGEEIQAAIHDIAE